MVPSLLRIGLAALIVAVGPVPVRAQAAPVGAVAVTTLAANLPTLDEPTTGLVHQGRLVFVSRSQWSDFADDGSLRTGPPAPAVILQLQLD